MSEPSFTGRTRKRTTSRRVVFADKASRFLITTGGIGTILAVVAICVFLVYVVVPLFKGGRFEEPRRLQVETAPDARVLHTAIDEYEVMAWELFDDGSAQVHRLDPWKRLATRRPFGDSVPVAYAIEGSKLIQDTRSWAVFGFDDGSVRVGRMGFLPEFLTEGPEPETLRDLEVGETRVFGEHVAQRTPERQLRVQRFDVDFEEPIRRESSSPIRAIDLTIVERAGQEQPVFVVLDEAGSVVVYKTRKRKNLLTGKVTVTLTPSRVPFEIGGGQTLPDRVLISALGDVVYLVWDDGRLHRFYKSPETGDWSLAERLDLVPTEGAAVSTAGFLIGRASLVVGDTSGRVAVWFRARPEQGVASGTADGFRFTAGHVLYEQGPAATALAPSSSSKLLLVGFEDGQVRAVFVTNQNHIAGVRAQEGPVERLALSPRETRVLAATPDGFQSWGLDAGYPDVTFATLFRPQWYEGFGQPEHVWQSTGATNEFEPKLGMMPLIHGTLKATFYSLLFGVPIALLAAVFTSEFLSSRVKVPIKSTIEVMASLPSVVLGFLAALVIAPFVQNVIPSIVVAFLTIPAMFLLGAYLWQLLPHALTLRLGLGARFIVMGLFLVLGILIAGAIGPSMEKAFFWVAEQQQSVAFRATADGEEPLPALTNEDLVTAIRLQAGVEPPAEAARTDAQRARLERLRAERLVFHDGTWRKHYARGRDFAWVDLEAGPDGEAVALDAPLRIRRLDGGALERIVDGDTAAQRAQKSLYVALGRKPDIKAWLSNPANGPATGGWFLLTLPLAALLSLLAMGRYVRPWLRRATAGKTRGETATMDLGRYLIGGVLTVAVGWLLAVVFTWAGMDLRGPVLGTYIQRNALVVGFVMGFAIIPIIYTLAEDALSSVPSHLREGSLGAGATPWQTAMRIIVPTAMSGLFSAVMIGLGRAVGETMIVLMAAGNTPIIDWNPFNGFRTLSANIAVELPEAVRGSSHYRALFLNALVLFAMTFVVNTFAEAVRQRFRKRAFQL